MFKIFTSCIILAICINFQKVEASNPLGSLLDNVRNQLDNVGDQLNNTLHGAIEAGSKGLQNIEKGAADLVTQFNQSLTNEMQRLWNISETFMRESRNTNTSSCTKLYNEGHAIFAEIISMFGSCLLTEMKNSNMNISNLIDLIRSLQETLPEQLQDILKCFKNPSNMIPCLTEVLQNVGDLRDQIEKTSREFFKLVPLIVEMIPNVGTCYEREYLNHTRQNSFDLPKDAIMCVEDTVIKYIRGSH